MSTLLRSPDEEVRRAAVAALSEGDQELALLIEAMGDDSWRVRKAAVERAEHWGQRERAAGALVETLAEPDNVGRRNAAVEALTRIGGASVGPLLVALGQHLEHRKLVVDTLGLIGDQRAAAPLVSSLDDSDPNVRAATAEALGLIGGPVAERALLGALGRGELLLSLACLSSLNLIGAALPRDRVEPMLDVAVLRPAVLAALGRAGDPAALPLLVRYLGHQSRAVREAATLAVDALCGALDEPTLSAQLSSLPPVSEQALRLLVQALLEGAPATRRSAASVLGLCCGVVAVRPLVLALGDVEVEGAAARALARLPAEMVGPLSEMVGVVDGAMQIAIFRIIPSLRAATDSRVQAVLVSALLDSDGEVAAEAVRALGAVGGTEVVDAVLGAFDREDLGAATEEALAALSGRFADAVRVAVLARGFAGSDARHLCRVLGACGRAEDALVLQGLIGGDRAPLRAAAVESLAQLVGESASQDVFARIVACLEDASPEVRASAGRAIAPWPRARGALAARERVEEDPLVRAVLAAALAQPASHD